MKKVSFTKNTLTLATEYQIIVKEHIFFFKPISQKEQTRTTLFPQLNLENNGTKHFTHGWDIFLPTVYLGTKCHSTKDPLRCFHASKNWNNCISPKVGHLVSHYMLLWFSSENHKRDWFLSLVIFAFLVICRAV